MKAFSKMATALALSMAMVMPSFGATEIDEKSFGPTYGTAMADAVVGKPLGLAAVVGGTAAWIVSLPFTIFTGDVENARRVLVEEPFQAMDRCLGCTPAQHNYYKTQEGNQNHVRLVVDGPSEILINTNQQVIVNE